MNEKKEKMFRIGTMIGSILLSVIVTIVSALKFKSDGNIGEGNISLDSLQIGISLLLGCCTFMIIELISLVFYSISYTIQKRQDDEFMENITEYSKMLYDINRDFYIVSKDSHGPHDLFVTYAKKEIEKLNSILSKAANQKEFSISSDYIVNATGVFDAFSQVTGKKVLKMTFPIWKEDNAIFTSQADIHFFEVLKLKMDSKEVDGVEVILIYDDKKLLDRSDVKKLLNFFSAEEGYTCKVALLNDFKTVCESNGVSSQFVDFGIYGPKMLYITEQYLPIHKRTYYKDETRVRHYTRLFDEVWNSDVITKSNPSNNTTHVGLAEIIR